MSNMCRTTIQTESYVINSCIIEVGKREFKLHAWEMNPYDGCTW